MITATDWMTHARRLLVRPAGIGLTGVPEIDLRRAVSAAYSGLFHALTLAGSSVFARGDDSLRFQTTRAFSHTAVRKVCAAYVRSPLKPFTVGYEHLNEHRPSPELVVVARTFELLQEGRYTADYDLLAQFEVEEAERLVELAEAALIALETVRTSPDTMVFLTALLLSDKWTRRG